MASMVELMDVVFSGPVAHGEIVVHAFMASSRGVISSQRGVVPSMDSMDCGCASMELEEKMGEKSGHGRHI